MQKLKTFFSTLFQSSTSPEYYQHVIQAPFGFSLKYLIAFYFFVTLIVLAPAFAVIAHFNAQDTIRKVAAIFPADLQMTVANGQFFINKPLPYIVPIPQDLEIDTETRDATRAALVVFEKDENIQNLQDVRNYNTMALITETSVYLLKDSDTGEMRAYPIPRTEQSITLSRAMVDSMLVRITEHPFIASRVYAPLAWAFLFLFVYPFMIVGSLLSLLFLSFFPYLVTRIVPQKRRLTYRKIYQMSMHAQTPLILLNLATLRLLGYELLTGLLYTLAFTLVVFLLVRALKAHTVLHKKKRK